ncbi:MAG: hypothetical protein AAGF33_05360 [Pseudomonadota bacterium]
MFEATSLPLSGGLLAAALWAGVAVFALGPEIANRELERDGWHAACAQKLVTQIEETRARPSIAPPAPNICGMLTGIDPQMGGLCRFIPEPGDMLREVERQRQAEETARINRALRDVTDACACAAGVYVEEHRLALGIYAGSARLITPGEITHRDAALTRALRAPICRTEG